MKLAASLVCMCGFAFAAAGQPAYTITDLGLVDPGDFASQGWGISEGGVAIGSSSGSGSRAFTWTVGSGQMTLPDFAGKAFEQPNGANDAGVVVGTGSDTFFGSGAVPLVWSGGSVSSLPIISGLGVGRANAVNSSGIVVGSNGGGTTQFATYWDMGVVNQITATAPGGVFMRTAYGVNDSGIAVGEGLDPGNAARLAGLVYDIHAGVMIEMPPLPGDNSMIAFDVSNGGQVTGSSSFNSSGSVPFIWTSSGGTVEIPMPSGASTGSGRGVNADGWVVGNAGGVFAVPFLWDGTQTYRVQDLIPSGTGWDLSMNTSSSALGISDDGSIVGTGVFNGDIRAYLMTPVAPAGCNPADLNDASAPNPASAGWGVADGLLSPTDFSAFALFFGTGDLRADLNDASAPNPGAAGFGVPDGLLTPTDFSAFAQYFGAGCPCSLPGCP